MSDLHAIDATGEQLLIVKDILRRNVPHLAVWAFGSRTRNTAKKYSDLDLAIITDDALDLGVHATLVDEFSNSNLPWKVDIVDWALTDDVFRDVIREHYVVIQSVQELEDVD